MRCTIAALVQATLLVVGFGPMVAAEQVGPIKVSAQSFASKDNRSGRSYGTDNGYVEYRVRLENLSKSEQHVELSYPGTGNGRRPYGVVVTRAVRLAGGQSVSVSLFQPAMGVSEDELEVRVDGVVEPATIPLPSLYNSYHPDAATRSVVLISRGVPQEFCNGMRAEEKPVEAAASGLVVATGTTEPQDRFAYCRSEVSTQAWSPNWLGYSCYDAIVVTGKEASEMPPPVQSALRRYLECGGTLFVQGPGTPAMLTDGSTKNHSGERIVGLGRVSINTASTGQKGWLETYEKLNTHWTPASRPTQRPTNLYGMLVAETRVPVRGLFILVLLFGIAIGPANLFVLSRLRRRVWLWWNVPAMSLLTCLLVFAYATAAEGWRGHGKRASLTVLDERNHRATTIGYLSYYCPLTPAGPRFSSETEVTLLDEAMGGGFRRYGYPGHHLSNDLRFIDWTDGQVLASGWIPARAPTYLSIRKNENRRERLSLTKMPDGSLKVVNALGANIRQLCLADDSGLFFEGTDIPAGAERTLRANGQKAVGRGIVDVQTILNRAGWLDSFQQWQSNQGMATNGSNTSHEKTRNISALLAANSYVAFLDRSPFLDDAVPSATTQDSVAIVYGLTKGQDDGRQN